MDNLDSLSFPEVISFIGYAIESVGVIVIVIGSILATVRIFRDVSLQRKEGVYQSYRRDLARSMMLGLEFLVAGDIVRTVVVASSLDDVLSLGLIVLIRTVLVFTLHLEIEGRWPWQPLPPNAEQ